MNLIDYEFKDLKNKKIQSIIWDEQNIIFNTQNGPVEYEAYGDCCSSSFIESLDNEEIFKDSVLESVEAVSGDQKDIDDYYVHKWTFYKFKTDKGMCTLSFRNESNGYYDGSLVLRRE
jgi:hypothetical protein